MRGDYGPESRFLFIDDRSCGRTGGSHGPGHAARQRGRRTSGQPYGATDLPSGSELDRYNDTYDGLESFWGDDVISRVFKHVADGTLNQVTPLVAELCDKWRNRDPHLPVTGVISVPPGIELDLNRLCR